MEKNQHLETNYEVQFQFISILSSKDPSGILGIQEYNDPKMEFVLLMVSQSPNSP